MKFYKLSFPSKLLILCANLAFATTAHALTITPDSGVIDNTRWEFFGGPAQPAIVSWAEGKIGDGGVFLYKADAPSTIGGPLSGSYSTEFLYTPTEPSGATIKYTGGPYVGPIAYLLVKDGIHEPNAYLFNLTGISEWDGKETLELRNFWLNKDGKGSISNVSLYGTPVPEPGTILLLGAGLVGLVAVSRRKFIRK